MKKVNDINLVRSIEVFMSVVEMGQVTAAAEALGISQSAASQQLRNLEDNFDVRLFDRSQRPLRLTHAGEALRRRASRVLNEIEDLRSDFRRMSRSTIPILRAAMLPSIATTLTPTLTDYVTRDLRIPELSLSASLSSDHQPILMARKLDFVITADALIETGDLEVHELFVEPFYLVLPKDYDDPSDDVEQLSLRLPLIRFSASTPVGRKTDQHLQRLRLDLPRAMEADRSSMVVAGVSSGRGFAILSPTLLIDALVEGMKLRVAPLPFRKFSRSIKLLARTGDLGTIPVEVACRTTTVLRSEFNRLLPDLPYPVQYAPEFDD